LQIIRSNTGKGLQESACYFVQSYFKFPNMCSQQHVPKITHYSLAYPSPQSFQTVTGGNTHNVT